MPTMDIFNQDAFSTIELTAAIERNPFPPQGLGQLGIFEPMPIRTTTLAVEERSGQLVLIPFSERGQEGKQRTTEKRKMRHFDVPRLMHDDTLTASELQNIREFGTETELMQVQSEAARRLNGPTGLLQNLEYTLEYHRLAAVQGKLLDADGTLMYDFFDEFGFSVPAEVAFNLAANVQYTLRPIVNGIKRTMARAAQGAFTTSTKIVALCGDLFYDELTTHVDVEKTFINWQDAKQLRDGSQGAAFESFDFAGITWLNYRGSDDTTTIAIATDKVKFFPVGAAGIFKVAYSPGESFDWANTPGKPVYVIPVMDKDRNMWFKQEVYSYPLHICTRPDVLQTGKAGA